MTVEIEIIDRVYHNIEDFCNVNGLDIKEYMSDAITEKYNLDRYGDLNEKLTKKEEKKPSTRSTKKEEKILPFYKFNRFAKYELSSINSLLFSTSFPIVIFNNSSAASSQSSKDIFCNTLLDGSSIVSLN